MKIIPKSECIWCIRKGDEYTTRYKSGHKDTTLILPDEIDDDNFSIFVVEDIETVIIYLNRKYIFICISCSYIDCCDVWTRKN